MRGGSARGAIGAVFGGCLFAAAMFAACGDDCNSPGDCELGEACFAGACLAVNTGQPCSIDLDCRVAEAPGATAFCNGGQCQLRLERPEPPDPDAGVGDAGPGADECNPADPGTCPMAETCEREVVGGTPVLRCIPAGSVAIGDECDNAVEAERCTNAGTCLRIDTATVGTCFRACDGDNPCTAPESCTSLLGVSFGICE